MLCMRVLYLCGVRMLRKSARYVCMCVLYFRLLCMLFMYARMHVMYV